MTKDILLDSADIMTLASLVELDETEIQKKIVELAVKYESDFERFNQAVSDKNNGPLALNTDKHTKLDLIKMSLLSMVYSSLDPFEVSAPTGKLANRKLSECCEYFGFNERQVYQLSPYFSEFMNWTNVER